MVWSLWNRFHRLHGLSLVRPRKTVVKNGEGQWMVLGFGLDDGSGGFAGRISDPIPLKQAAPALFDGAGPYAAGATS